MATSTGSRLLPANDPCGPAHAVTYDVLECTDAGPNPPATKRIPAGWSAFALVYGRKLALKPVNAATVPCHRPVWLRLTTAIDDRVLRTIAVSLPSGQSLGILDLRYAHAIEMFELELAADDALAARRDGVVLSLQDAGDPIWFFSSSGGSDLALPTEYHPHLMSAQDTVDRTNEFYNRFASLASLQGFGWMEGCILDGLRGLERFAEDKARYRQARKSHWSVFAGSGGELSYESPRSEVFTSSVYGIEGGLPFADLAFDNPQHPWLAHFAVAMARLRRPDGAIQDAEFLSAEGSYTVAFPLAALAGAWISPELAAEALNQLRIRKARLWYDDALWLRCTDSGERSFRNWARAIAWYLLGLMRTLELLRTAPCETSDLETEAVRVAKWALAHQRDDGLWSVYVDDHALATDTSGSAAIATALALGARIGLLSPIEADAARHTLASLEQRLTPDGFLGGTSQANRGGEVLQRSDYRVLSQMAMGLKAQLLAEILALEQTIS